MSEQMNGASIAVPKPTRESVEAKVKYAESAIFGGRLTVMVLTMENGQLFAGHSVAATQEAFRQDVGEQVAFERAIETAFEVEVYLWRQQQWEADGRPEVVPPVEPEEKKVVILTAH